MHVDDQRLPQLPVVFSTADAAALFSDLDASGRRVMLNRWKELGLIRPAGPRSKLYYNLMLQSDWQAVLSIAVCRAYPSATLIGPNVLRRAGWTTQIARDLHVAVLKARTYARLDGVQIHPRSHTWYEEKGQFGISMEGLPSITAEQALWDSLEHRHEIWCPDPDDLDRAECGAHLYEEFCRRWIAAHARKPCN
jgi:hypothetical protein